jgi:hypothetical protein
MTSESEPQFVKGQLIAVNPALLKNEMALGVI